MTVWVVQRGEFETDNPCGFIGPFETKEGALAYMETLVDQHGATAMLVEEP